MQKQAKRQPSLVVGKGQSSMAERKVRLSELARLVTGRVLEGIVAEIIGDSASEGGAAKKKNQMARALKPISPGTTGKIRFLRKKPRLSQGRTVKHGGRATGERNRRESRKGSGRPGNDSNH